MNPADQTAMNLLNGWTAARKKEEFELESPGWSVKPLSFWFKKARSLSVHIFQDRGMRTGHNYWLKVFKTIRELLIIFYFWQQCISSRADWVFKPIASNYSLFSLSRTEQATLLQASSRSLQLLVNVSATSLREVMTLLEIINIIFFLQVTALGKTFCSNCLFLFGV